jgi:hypothetical protein
MLKLKIQQAYDSDWWQTSQIVQIVQNFQFNQYSKAKIKY